MTDMAEPRIQRDINLHMHGDWGQANLHRIFGWLSFELGRRTGADSRFAIWNGHGGSDALAAVASGEAELALFVPAGFAATALAGRGVYDGEGIERLRAIGTLPQDDRMVLAVDARFGVNTLDDIRRLRPALRIATSPDDGVNMVGYAAHRLLEAAGMPRAEIERWGGVFIEGETPVDVIPLVTEGAADAVLHEAIMTPHWRAMTAARRMTFIPIDADVLDALEASHGWARGTVPVGRFAGCDTPFETLDFSDFLLIARDDLADDIAGLIAWCLCETRETIERQYRHMAPEDSPITYPLDPAKIAITSIPLHDGAARYYLDAGLVAE